MSTQQQKKTLMIVVTRAYAKRGSIDDEFVHEWGFAAQDKYSCRDDHARVLLFVIHGCQEVEPDDAIATAFQEKSEVLKGADLNTAWLFHHSLKDKQEGVKKAVCTALSGTQLNVFGYSSAGRSAVDGLTRILEDGKNSNDHYESFGDAVKAAATGRRMFAERLHSLRARLLCLRLLFDAGASREFQLVAAEQRSETEDLLEHERWGDWRRALTGNEDTGSVADAIKQLRCLAFPGKINELPECLRPHDAWREYFSQQWAASQRPAAERIRNDLARFARATDVIIDALDDLPVKAGSAQ